MSLGEGKNNIISINKNLKPKQRLKRMERLRDLLCRLEKLQGEYIKETRNIIEMVENIIKDGGMSVAEKNGSDMDVL